MTKKMKWLNSALRASCVMTLTILAACSGSTEPKSLAKLNTAAALADYNALDGLLQSSGWKNFQMTAGGMNAMGSVTTSVVAASAVANLTSATGSSTLTTAVASLAANGIAGIQLISSGHLGKTFIYDAALHTWVVDAARTGAPSNGVRFITYQPKGAEPDPTKPTGHADLIDLGNSSAGVALRLVVVEGTLTILDYQTSVDASSGVGHVAVGGFLQNSQDKLEFDIDVHGQNVNGVDRGDISFDLAIASRDFHVEGDIHSEKTGSAEHSTVDLSVRHGTASFRVDVANDLGVLSGTVDLNNAPFATVSGRDKEPVFKAPSGGDLNGAEGMVLWRVFDITEDVFDLFEDLIDPIDDLVILAIIL